MVRNNNAGFSLIELMIATTLLSVVMFSGYFAYSMYTERWQKRTDTFWELSQNAMATDMINRALHSTAPFIVAENADPTKPLMLFQGTQSQLTFVSNSPIGSSGIALINLRFHPETQVLSYREIPLDKDIYTTWPLKGVSWSQPIQLLVGLDSFQVDYYGFENLAQMIEHDDPSELTSEPIKPQWYDAHNPLERRVLPQTVRLTWEQEGQRTQLHFELPRDSSARLFAYMRVGA
ncbi:prepilin-type N-terminal cleavage/methylation domain-containing protein [Pseudoalteromonas sp. CnMc7-15]|uniref:prepilin-type N-terminal cleavage/methylation domain-containing protein n=1 Tax=unclassified Pseudoalteromonas TaxID=194690 RepID=UPI001EF52245|nr:prepilin-type N-terminal cleavage/methylation domain-containing protein [Pseudoalteromonas sp. CnMc7-15]MCG7566518.1 prepilin-type N-terminal cleavage/methylation domain-containing protein [Pseudoalteromonas sp. CnMc7-15]